MKRTLLIAIAALSVSLASAQALISSKKHQTGVPAVQRPALEQVKLDNVVKAHPLQHQAKMVTKESNLGKKLTLSKKQKQSMKTVSRSASKAASSRAKAAPRRADADGDLLDYYTGVGKDYDTNKTVNWTMDYVFVDAKTQCLVDMIPLPSALEDLDSIGVTYRWESDNEIAIDPTVVAELEDEENGTVYVMLFSGVDEEGVIYLTVDEDKHLTTSYDNDSFVYGAWTQDEYEYDDEAEELVGYLGHYEIVSNIKYYGPDQVPAPTAQFEPAYTYFQLGSSSSGYGYYASLAAMPPFVPMEYQNLTSDMADAWSWYMTKEKYNSEAKEYETAEEYTADTKNFTITPEDAVYTPAQLTASFSGEQGEPFQWGSVYIDEDTGDSYDPHVYGSAVTSSFVMSDSTTAMLTRANTKDFGYYYSGSFPTYNNRRETIDYGIGTLISYQGKPSAPLYITGVLFNVYQLVLNDEENFSLTCKIQKMTFDEQGKVVLGDVLAESEITREDLPEEIGQYSTPFEFTNFYVEDEWGMTETIDYLFVEDEFAVVIEGWDNGTFDCYPLIDAPDFGIVSNTYFIKGEQWEDNAIYHYTNNYQHLDLGFYGGWGYLHTNDNTDFAFGAEGGSATIHVLPMYYGIDDDTEEATYSLYVESVTENDELLDSIPDWIHVEITNEDYSKDENGNFINGIDYDMVITVDSLDATDDVLEEGTTRAEGDEVEDETLEGRTAQIVFMQTAAKLVITIKQDNSETPVNPDGITTVVEKIPVKNSRAFNLAGQPVGKNFKGVMLKDGKKVIIK